MSSFPFRFYHPDRSTLEWRNKLPHLEQAGICYFVTFMAKDAMPPSAKITWEKRRREWLLQHGLSPDLSREEVLQALPPERRGPFDRMCSAAYQRALDGGSGGCLLARLDLREMVVEALRYHAGRTCFIADFVVMPNHVHMLVQPHSGETLKKILGSIRSFSARQINLSLGRQGRFWSREPFDHMIRSRRYFERYRQYIRANPKRATLPEGMYTMGSFWDP